MRRAIVVDGRVTEVNEWDYDIGVPLPEGFPDIDNTWLFDGENFFPDPTLLKKRLIDAVQSHLDSVAQSRGYDNILSAATYAISLHPRFSVEGVKARDWRDAVWQVAYQAMVDVEAGLRAVPSADELIAELPILDW